jgi:hypothetical protein
VQDIPEGRRPVRLGGTFRGRQVDPVPEYADFTSRLRDVLENLGTLEVEGGAGSRPALLTPDGRRFVFAQTLAQMHAAVSRIDGEVLSDPADSSPLEGQLRLFSVHVWEAVETAPATRNTADHLLRRHGRIAGAEKDHCESNPQGRRRGGFRRGFPQTATASHGIGMLTSAAVRPSEDAPPRNFLRDPFQ